jgi:hypothetical protein
MYHSNPAPDLPAARLSIKQKNPPCASRKDGVNRGATLLDTGPGWYPLDAR